MFIEKKFSCLLALHTAHYTKPQKCTLASASCGSKCEHLLSQRINHCQWRTHRAPRRLPFHSAQVIWITVPLGGHPSRKSQAFIWVDAAGINIPFKIKKFWSTYFASNRTKDEGRGYAGACAWVRRRACVGTAARVRGYAGARAWVRRRTCVAILIIATIVYEVSFLS